MRFWIAPLLLLSLTSCLTSLKDRLEKDLATVNYRDGVTMSEAKMIAQHYRLNNLKWVALDDPLDDGDYWSFGLMHGRTYEPLDDPPLLIFKKAWSYKSAVVTGKKPTTPPAFEPLQK